MAELLMISMWLIPLEAIVFNMLLKKDMQQISAQCQTCPQLKLHTCSTEPCMAKNYTVNSQEVS